VFATCENVFEIWIRGHEKRAWGNIPKLNVFIAESFLDLFEIQINERRGPRGLWARLSCLTFGIQRPAHPGAGACPGLDLGPPGSASAPSAQMPGGEIHPQNPSLPGVARTCRMRRLAQFLPEFRRLAPHHPPFARRRKSSSPPRNPFCLGA